MKFKVGDKVRVIGNTDEPIYDTYIGRVGYIDDVIDFGLPYAIEFDNEMLYWCDEELELFEESVADVIYRHINREDDLHMENKEKTTYLGGDLLKKGSIMLRNAEAEELRGVGVKIYSPIEDKSINDKSNVSKEDNDKLAERIVKNDTRAIINSDYIIIEPQDDAKGTMVELGQLKGMKDASRMLDDIVYTWQNEGMTNEQLHKELVGLISKLDKKVYPHYEDIRRTDIEECGDRRSLGINQYVYGVCLDLTDGKGFYEWDNIVEEMREIYKKDWHDEYIELYTNAYNESLNKIKNIDEDWVTNTWSMVDLEGLYKKSNMTIDDFYEDIYKINKHYDFNKYVFISNYYKQNLQMQVKASTMMEEC